ncbi:HIV Tat-specific factor 1 isoform X2 [Protopterus annectens]|nr:HIV Tat-specific factor 1 isoform X2 [Protopterus annectens]XP_043921225.1 HIV Tat-specific factor 1 isoform X2 [Protopterus annectens]
MSGTSDANAEFYEQLQMEQLYGSAKDENDCNDPYHYVDPSDGTVYEWDHEKKAWFPKITDDFLAVYQANYGFTSDGGDSVSDAQNKADPPKTTVDNQDKCDLPKEPVGSAAENPEETSTPSEKSDSKAKGEKRKADPGWFNVEEQKNTNVYVTGLPLDFTIDEFVELMSKYGIIMRDPESDDFKVKLYKDSEGNLKGDGLCCYLKKESVELALKLLEDYEIRGYKIHVEVAKFQLKGQYDVSKKKKKSKEHRKKLLLQQKQLDWRPEKKFSSRLRHERVVIFKNMFHPNDFEENPLDLAEIQEDLRTECEKSGQVKKIIIFDRHPEGVASVSFKEPEEADLCIEALHGRWFGGRRISAETWDGITDYKVEETTSEREERLKVWESFLEENRSQTTNTNTQNSVATNEGVADEKHSQDTTPNDNEHLQDSTSNDNSEQAVAKTKKDVNKNQDAIRSTDSSPAGSDAESDEGGD